MSHRFFLNQKIQNGKVTLEGPQAHHAVHVMRFGVGDTVTLFDGRGHEHVAAIETIGKKKMQLAIESTQHTPPLFATHVSIAVAPPKGDRQKFLVEKLVELGVTRMIPLKTARSVVAANDNVIQRFRKWVIEASKQCGRNYLMEVTPGQTIPSVIAMAQNDTLDATNKGANNDPHPGAGPSECYVADPYARAVLPTANPAEKSSSRPIVIAIGPEGGLTPEETDQLKTANWKSVTLGPTILRIETAAIAAAVLTTRRGL